MSKTAIRDQVRAGPEGERPEQRVAGRGGKAGASRWRWHLDEVLVKVNGVQHYLWRAVDHEGEVLEPYFTKTMPKQKRSRAIRGASACFL